MADSSEYLHLKKDGSIKKCVLDNAVIRLAGEIDPASLGQVPESSSLAIEFASSADGRGYSLAKHLRNRLDFHGELVALGALIPDQVVAAFACGFDAVLVTKEQQDKYGQQNWLDAASSRERTDYWARGTSGAQRVWTERTL